MRSRRGKPPATPAAAAKSSANCWQPQTEPAADSSAAVAGESSQTDDAGDGRHRKFKIVFLGNSGVGKTWLVERVLVRQRTLAAAPPPEVESGTIGVAVNLSRARLAEGRTALLQLWDTSGREKYRNLVRSYVSGAHCVVLAYEPSGGLQASRQALARWHTFANEASAATSSDVLFAVVAISRRGGGREESAAAGINFGRVFASSLCGCFFHQTGCGGRPRREGQQLTPRWLADQLVRRQQARSEAVARLLGDHRQQQQLMLAQPQRAPDTGADVETAGCFWCQRLLCCRAVKCGGGCVSRRN